MKFWCILFSLTQSFAHAELDVARTPPTKIYHFGVYQYLMNDVAAHTVPEQEWNQYVMGDLGRFGLPPFRRGFYGADTPIGAYAYGDELIGTGKMPWFIIIEIKDECRKKPAILDYTPFSLYADSAFVEWVKLVKPMGFETIQKVLKKCYPSLASYGYPNDRSSKLSAYGGAENSCDRLVNQFLTEKNIKVVSDQAWPNSWYIRDRNCIENISGSPTDILNLMIQDSKFWNPGHSGEQLSDESNDDNHNGGSSYGPILIKVLTETKPSLQQLLLLKNNMRGLNVGHDFNFEKVVVAANIRCVHQGKTQTFNELARSILNKIVFDQAMESGYLYKRATRDFSLYFNLICKN